MPNPILHKRSSTAGVVPHAALLANGELALNTADGTWFLKRTDGTVLDLRQPLITDGGAQPLAGINADAQDWQTRVIAAGGTVSATTFTAVNNFCNAITAAGIRDRFYRLNLFCGDNLTAALVPLYRGPSLAGTQYGNTTDTNNSFGSGDYVETGTIAGGLKGGSPKYLNTGFPVNTVPTSGRHLAVYEIVRGATQFDIAIGAEGPGQLSQQFSLGTGATGANYGFRYSSGTNFKFDSDYTQKGAMYIGSQTGTTGSLYKNGAAVTTTDNGTNDGLGGTTNNSSLYVFALNRANSLADYSGGTFGAYSVGLDMTAAQALAYYNAMQTFQTALTRGIPTATNADAQDWITRVHTAGGTVSQSTANAVNTFCNTIDNAGIRDRFYRLNLFCGNDLTACLVPLYRGQTRTGTQYGNTTDTNIAFTSPDYAETGVSGGLSSNGSSKYLDTGLAVSALPTLSTGHIAAYKAPGVGNNSHIVAVRDETETHLYRLFRQGGSNTTDGIWGGVTVVAMAQANKDSGSFLVVSRTSATSVRLYGSNAFISENTTSTTPASTTRSFYVFADNNGTTSRGYWPAGIPLRAYSIGAALTDAQVATYTTAMAAFQTSLNRPPVVANAEAQSWIDRVYAAGGAVSQSTANAVNTFCDSINSAGLRDRFYRLNLFCGNDLTACCVPLYRGQSLSGTQYGNTTDTNFNFVASDYVEAAGLIATGAAGDAVPGGAKRLDTGLAPSSWPVISSFHASAFVFGVTNSAGNQAVPIGVRSSTAPSNRWGFDYRQTTVIFDAGANLNLIVGTPALATTQHWLTNRTSVTSFDGYINGLPQITNTTDVTASLLASNLTFFVFGQNLDGSLVRFFGLRLGGYSLGAGMTATQAAAFSTAMTTFQLALNRAV